MNNAHSPAACTALAQHGTKQHSFHTAPIVIVLRELVDHIASHMQM